MAIDIHPGDIIRHHRPGVGIYQCEVLAVHDDSRKPLSLRPCGTRSPRPVHGRPFRAGLGHVRGIVAYAEPALCAASSNRLFATS